MRITSVNWITNILGSFAGGAQLLEAYGCYTQDNMGCAITKALEGLGIMAVAYFVGKKSSDFKP